MGCLSTDPEPFGTGGVYLEYCLAKPAWVRLEVYTARRVLWRTRYRWNQAGAQQVWYPGTAGGVALEPGSYAFAVTAYFGPGLSVTRTGSLTRGDAP